MGWFLLLTLRAENNRGRREVRFPALDGVQEGGKREVVWLKKKY